VGEDPLADGDLPLRIRIAEQPVAGEQQQQIDARADASGSTPRANPAPQRSAASPKQGFLG